MKNLMTETVGERLNPKQRDWYRDRLGRVAGMLARRLFIERAVEVATELKAAGGK